MSEELNKRIVQLENLLFDTTRELKRSTALLSRIRDTYEENSADDDKDDIGSVSFYVWGMVDSYLQLKDLDVDPEKEQDSTNPEEPINEQH